MDKTKVKESSKDSAEPNSRSKLLDAALELFSRHSFHGTTTKMIAQQAGVNESLIMRHFKNKEGLFLAVLETRVTCDDEELSYPPQETLEDELQEFAKERMADCTENSDFMRIVLAQALIDTEFRKYVQREFQKPASKYLQARLTALQKAGKIDKKANLHQLEDVVSNQMFAVLYLSVLVYEQDIRTTMTKVRFGLSAIARAFAA